MSPLRILLAAVVLSPACAYQGTPVPVAGDTRILAGDWEGTYLSEQSGRAGNILFRLKAGTDSAWGDVLMVPARSEQAIVPPAQPSPEWRRTPTQVLRISFVRCEEGKVTGSLDPYNDPDTGELLHTVFEGRLRGNEFRGTFSTSSGDRAHVVAGTWSVKRRK